ncbi:General aromatic amino acid permease [Serratia fonticola]|uniref:General aromatic amino acid permease n=2 Tax=Serratia fonticola TaxID=47917 RepID=A0A4U9U5Q2_SERFO|nr:General aromatic amino acid permease [Serratia fonticola]
MLYGLAKQGNGPKALLKVDSRGVPVVAIGFSALATALCVLINYLIPGRAFELLMALVVSALVINWAMISLAHLKFRKAKNHEGVEPKFKAFWYPFSNYLCLAFLAAILVIMYLTPGIQISVLLIPVWLAILGIGYFIKQRGQQPASAASR